MLLICVIVGGENLVWPYWTRILVGVVYREIYVPLHRYNLKYSRNPDSSSCWTRLYTECHSIIKRFEFGIHDVHSLYMYQICGPLYTVQELKRYRTSSKDPKICVTIIRLKLIHWDPSSPTAFYDIDDHNRIRRKNL